MEKAVDRLSEMLGAPEGEPLPLEGGITNRNFRARFGEVEVVIRLPGKDTDQLGIDRVAEREATEAAAAVGVGPEAIALLDDPPCLVTRFIAGEPLEPEALREPDLIEAVAAALRRVHGATVARAVFSPFRVVEEYARRTVERGGALPEDHGWAAGIAARIERTLSGPEHEPVLCHDDLLAANFLRTGDGLRIVDWEYAGMGDRFFDLGNFAVNNGLDARQEADLLGLYFGDRPTPARLASLRLMRFMSDYREAMWGVLQSVLSDIEFDFDGYAREHFERMRAAAGGAEIESWLEDAGVAAG